VFLEPPPSTTASTTLRLPVTTLRRVREIAARTGQSLASVVDTAIALYEDHLFWEQVRAGRRRSGRTRT